MNYRRGFIGSSANIHTQRWGTLRMEAAALTEAIDGDLVVYVGDPGGVPEPLVRIHSICTFSDVFGGDMCECSAQLDFAMARFLSEGRGLLFYLRMEARGVGLAAKVKATALEVQGRDTYESRVEIGVSPDARDYRRVARFPK